MLLKDFYQVKSTQVIDAETWMINIELNPNHAVYEGHFPEQPVLPGVGTLQIIKEIVSSLLSTSLYYRQISSCKFISAINPRENAELEFTVALKEEEKGQWQLKADGIAGSEPFIKLKGILAEK
ncbi:hydroxymyristoyl-ACP dehydratase [Bacteroides sp. OttesenSCG-928-D19]|nr:hydroxymyristoyl-ACP dehydratase [Bacteroides sp. OttesenSCG-928-N06]MDL2305563.1 hydroxymyristoyl-ACP dehydratase [Bacteroides sp. OttesenSCG-928-D19]